MKSKICGISDSKNLEFLTNHTFPPEFIGFIVNYPKSKRFIEVDKLKNLLKIDKKNLYMLQFWLNQIKRYWKKLKIYLLITIKFMIASLMK